jgi:hypothetical protein
LVAPPEIHEDADGVGNIDGIRRGEDQADRNGNLAQEREGPACQVERLLFIRTRTLP